MLSTARVLNHVLIEINAQLHAPAALALGRDSSVRFWCGSQTRFLKVANREIPQLHFTGWTVKSSDLLSDHSFGKLYFLNKLHSSFLWGRGNPPPLVNTVTDDDRATLRPFYMRTRTICQNFATVSCLVVERLVSLTVIPSANADATRISTWCRLLSVTCTRLPVRRDRLYVTECSIPMAWRKRQPQLCRPHGHFDLPPHCQLPSTH
jgi:hypothetical protein